MERQANTLLITLYGMGKTTALFLTVFIIVLFLSHISGVLILFPITVLVFLLLSTIVSVIDKKHDIDEGKLIQIYTMLMPIAILIGALIFLVISWDSSPGIYADFEYSL